MGVHGLWKLLECSGRPINPETLEGKILAVDISIWLNQAIKGARDRHGNSIHNAHLLILFRRLCKLLFFRIRPIFVFDGEAPLLKRQTLAKRKQQKEAAVTDSEKTKEKLLKTFLKRQAIKAALSGKSNSEFPSLAEVRRKEVDDIYVLPALQEDKKDSSEEEDEKEWEERMTQKKILQKELLENPRSVDVESDDFLSLPPEIKHEILTDMKEFTKRRRTLFEAMPEESNDFSQYQLKGLLKKSSLNRHIEKVQKEMNEQHSGQIQHQYEEDGGFLKELETRRVVSEDTSHYILLKGTQSKGNTSSCVTSAIHSSAMPKDLKPSKNIASNDMQVKPVSCDLSVESTSSTYETSPSPRTMLAIQAAILGSDSEDELDDRNKKHLNLDKCESTSSVDSSNMSPRTIKAIQQALCEEEEEEEMITAPFINRTNITQGERMSRKDHFASSSDEEGAVPEDQNEKQLLPVQKLEGGNIKKSPCIPAVQKRLLSGAENEEKNVETGISQIDISPGQCQSPNNSIKQPEISLSPIPSVGSSHSGFAELAQTGKLQCLKELAGHSEKRVSCTQNEFLLALGTPKLEECVEHQQSEESDSDGSFIEVETEPKGEQDRTSETSLASIEEEVGVVSEASLEMREGSEDTTENKSESGEDAELTMQQNAGMESTEKAEINEWQNISMEDLEVLETNLSVEQTALQAQKQQQERTAATVTGQMFLESQELLRLFGIPYIEAPMEAEAQCAVLDLTDQTSGTITDDSDIWLFGGRHVYKNFFNQSKYVEYYQYVDFQNQLGLDRNKLINLAYLLGSDYTEGIPNVGYVTAMEILNEFPGRGLEPLLKLVEWWAEAQKNKKIRPNPYDTKVKKKLRHIEIAAGFPNLSVAEAYLHPVVDESKASFAWGRPNVEQIREFCQSHFGWTKLKTDEVLFPVLKQLNIQQTQLRIDSFFRLAQHEKQVIKSQRVRRAVTCMRRKEKEEDDSEVQEATAVLEKELKQKKGQAFNKGRAGCQKRGSKRKKCLPSQQQSVLCGGFVGEVLLSEASSESSAGDLENEASRKHRKGENAKMLETNMASHKTSLEVASAQSEARSSSSSAEEEMQMVTARPVFEGKKARGKTLRRRWKK
ncbi:DNA repair protein complementing XP-G cells isoform X1 [Notechis scutatus]|uniref:DNA repair protein complementing XP-G cells isoform X1 n=2 Tax=Notechis scutatus TaxID=8663 RepID=A0A6J1UA80_9SAUR|nr:DNA repair protein complementing XP-G cells isoform X1 [Notechis scutatus]